MLENMEFEASLYRKLHQINTQQHVVQRRRREVGELMQKQRVRRNHHLTTNKMNSWRKVFAIQKVLLCCSAFPPTCGITLSFPSDD